MTFYYNPEEHGLTPVGEISWTDEPYQFDLTVVWKDGQGLYYWASDSGCSCPEPFEYLVFADLETGSRYDLAEYLDGCVYHDNEAYARAQIVELLSRL